MQGIKSLVPRHLSSGTNKLSRCLVSSSSSFPTAARPTGNGSKPRTAVVTPTRQQSTTKRRLAATSCEPEFAISEEPVEHEAEFMQETTAFVDRHIGPREEDIRTMLTELGYQSLDGLIADTIPDQIRLGRELRLPPAMSEAELMEALVELGKMNEATEWSSFIGMGYYGCHTPAPIMRNLFENPGWTTAYTAYQAEIAQGRLESLMNFQTMVSELTGLDVANASLLDEATAAAEALQVCLRHDNKLRRHRWLVSSRCHPNTLTVVETRARPLGVQVDRFDELQPQAIEDLQLERYSGVLLQYPNSQGHLYDLDPLVGAAHAANTLVVVATDLLACTLFRPPGDFRQRPDMAVGSAQRLGVPLNFGGPHAGFLACQRDLTRFIPGRIVGVTRDSNGKRAYRFALQTREQHIRRDKATSNICTAQALLANMSAMYAVYHGPEGLRQIAGQVHAKTRLLASLLADKESVWLDRPNGSERTTFFDTLSVRLAEPSDSVELRRRATKQRINLRYYKDDLQLVGVSLDETTKLSDVFRLASLFPGADSNRAHGNEAQQRRLLDEVSVMSSLSSGSDIVNNNDHSIDRSLLRDTNFLTHPVFNTHRSEAQLVRYMKSLENKDISLVHSMIPLGSCTMKLNATSQALASSMAAFANCHPFQPVEQCRGYLRLFDELDEYLCEITGYDKISFQPNSGAQGEYAGLCAIRAYLESRAETHRQICLIPVSAHGTNPASAQMAGFRIQTVKVTGEGEIDLADLTKQIERHRNELACLMITYPSTFGVFEAQVRRVCDMVHEAGGQVYLDGANMNAQVGLCRPGDYGSDVSHLNLHKTFCIPHGGGGPGSGPIGVKRHLVPFLPKHPLGENSMEFSKPEESKSFGSVSAAHWGSPVILPMSWAYVRLMSSQLRRSSEVAILNANYMRKRLENHYKILYKGDRGNVAHEFIIDCRPFKASTGIEAIDIAKRLQDFGLHAPTVSWPVSNTMMIEPTESEDKEQLDNYCEALLTIRQEIDDVASGRLDKTNNPLKQAPHTQGVVCANDWSRPYSRQQAAFPASFVQPETKVWPTVGRVDDTYGDMNLFCSCPPPETKL